MLTLSVAPKTIETIDENTHRAELRFGVRSFPAVSTLVASNTTSIVASYPNWLRIAIQVRSLQYLRSKRLENTKPSIRPRSQERVHELVPTHTEPSIS